MTIHATRLTALRNEIASSGHDGFLVPMADEYQSEYVPPSAQRIEYLSGFTGSSGFIAVLKDKAAFFTDGRYTLQAATQLSPELFTIFDSIVKTPSAWLAENLPAKSKLAYDPWLHTDESVTRLKKTLAKKDIELVAIEKNPVDKIWHERPATPAEPIVPHDLTYAGEASSEKRAKIAAELRKNNLAAAIITDTASIAWLLNIRGNDITHSPLPLSFALLNDQGKIDWFVDPRKITEPLTHHLGPDITIKKPEDFSSALDQLATLPKPIRLDLNESANWIAERLRRANVKIDSGDDPSALPRACKNPVEIEGMRSAHRRDGVALTTFLHWLSLQPFGTVTELQAEEKLTELRAANNLYRGPSFATIAGSGPHGAIVHYRATETSNRTLQEGELFLLDSGGQYLDGTTDVTRTVAIGKPTDEMRDRFTRVLKGHIALAAICFPESTTGADLDALARQHLWNVGLDFSHGTGHGVGSYLGVHEGPQAISKRNKIALKPGMVVSNEPGYYQPGSYGIRIENLQTVIERPDLSHERKFLGFEPLTLAPIDQNLVEPSLMTQPEWNWLETYHNKVQTALLPSLTPETGIWLKKMNKY